MGFRDINGEHPVLDKPKERQDGERIDTNPSLDHVHLGTLLNATGLASMATKTNRPNPSVRQPFDEHSDLALKSEVAPLVRTDFPLR